LNLVYGEDLQNSSNSADLEWFFPHFPNHFGQVMLLLLLRISVFMSSVVSGSSHCLSQERALMVIY